jgi:hypothetical protein
MILNHLEDRIKHITVALITSPSFLHIFLTIHLISIIFTRLLHISSTIGPYHMTNEAESARYNHQQFNTKGNLS